MQGAEVWSGQAVKASWVAVPLYLVVGGARLGALGEGAWCWEGWGLAWASGWLQGAPAGRGHRCKAGLWEKSGVLI